MDINSLSVATIVAGDFVPFWDITAPADNKKTTFVNFEAALTHDNLVAGTIVSHDTTATGANLTSLTDNSIVDTLHRHSELVASDGSPDPALVVDAGGDVGIGTVFPNAPLEVKGAKPAGNVGGFQSGMFHVTGNGDTEFSNSVITGHNAYNTNTQLWYLGSMSISNNDIAFINRQNAEMHFYTNNAFRMVIDAGGNVGIGITNPQELVHIGAGIDASDISATDLLVTRAGPSNLSVRDSTNGVETFLFASSVGGIIGTVTNDPLNIQTNNTSAIFIDASQNVGIGTANPNEKLTLEAGVLSLKETTTPTATINYAKIYSKNTNTLWWQDGAGAEHLLVDSLHSHSELSASDGTPNPAVSVDAAGWVGMGTATPIAELDVRATNAQLQIGSDATAVFVPGQTALALTNGTEKFGFTAQAGFVVVSSVSNTPIVFSANNAIKATVQNTHEEITVSSNSTAILAVSGTGIGMNNGTEQGGVFVQTGGTVLAAITANKIFFATTNATRMTLQTDHAELTFGSTTAVLTTQTGIGFASGAVKGAVWIQSNGLVVGTITNDAIYFLTNNDIKMVLLENGNLGLGLASPNEGLTLEKGVISLKETTTPTATTNYAKIYSKNTNTLWWQDGAGLEHLLHGDSFSNIWFHNASTVEVTISTQNAFTLIDSFSVVGHEDDLTNLVGSTSTNNLTLSSIGGGEYEISFHASITATGGADKEMAFCMGITLATPKDITNVTDDLVTPIVITSVAHGLENGDMVEIAGVVGNTAANGSFIVDSKAADTFVIVALDGSATTGNGDFNEASPTGDVTIEYPGNMISHGEVRGSVLSTISVTGLHVLADNDVLAVYVANLNGVTNLTVAAISFDAFRIGD